jgi:hypothetical protein
LREVFITQYGIGYTSVLRVTLILGVPIPRVLPLTHSPTHRQQLPEVVNAGHKIAAWKLKETDVPPRKYAGSREGDQARR